MKLIRKIVFLVGLIFVSFSLTAQLSNDSASVLIEKGATFHVNMDVKNINHSDFTNMGHLEVTGAFDSDLGSTFTLALNAICEIYGGQPVLPISDSRALKKRIKIDQRKTKMSKRKDH